MPQRGGVHTVSTSSSHRREAGVHHSKKGFAQVPTGLAWLENAQGADHTKDANSMGEGREENADNCS